MDRFTGVPLPASAAIVLVGDEILRGDVHDVSGAMVARCLRKHGVTSTSIRVVPDDVVEIVRALTGLFAERAPALLVMVGGVGPTPDDVTYDAVAHFLGVPLVTDPQIAEWVDMWAQASPDSEGARRCLGRMAQVPQGAYLLRPEEVGGPVVAVDAVIESRTTIVMLPGSPNLVERALRHAVVPSLLDDGEPVDASVEILHHVDEAALGSCFEDLHASMPDVSVASYPGDPQVLRLAGDEDRLDSATRVAMDHLSRISTAPIRIAGLRQFDRLDDAASDLRAGNAVALFSEERSRGEACLVAAAATLTESQLALMVRRSSGTLRMLTSDEPLHPLLPTLSPAVPEDPRRVGRSPWAGCTVSDRLREIRAFAGLNPLDRRDGSDVMSTGHGPGLPEPQGFLLAAQALVRQSGLGRAAVVAVLTDDEGVVLPGDAAWGVIEREALRVISLEEFVSGCLTPDLAR